MARRGKRGRARRPEDLGRLSEPVFRPAGMVTPDVTGAYGGAGGGLGAGAMGLGGPPRGKGKGLVRRRKGGFGFAFGGFGGGAARAPRSTAPIQPAAPGAAARVTSGGYRSTIGIGGRTVPTPVSTKTPPRRRTGRGL